MTWLAVASWLIAFIWFAFFAVCWRMGYTTPNGLWAAGSIATVAVTVVVLMAICFWQVIRGPQRLRAIAVGMLGATPIVWLAMFLFGRNLEIQYRVPKSANVATCVAEYWQSSAIDFESRWRYPRRTEGQHVVLFDQNQIAEPAKLVAQMDQHIEQMAGRLHARVPTLKSSWVRGPLGGQHGMAIQNWAVCDTDQNEAGLTSLDRHEMAHVVIWLLGDVDQDPPTLLEEGWAETQSKDRADLILTLNSKSEGGIHSLAELVDSDWYRRAASPVYDHGGPLVVYLMEHYGSEKFLALYQGTRSQTFAADCERILGDSWTAVERDFWKWLADEAAKLKAARGDKPPPPGKTAKDVRLAATVDQRDWQMIVDGHRAAWSKRSPLPRQGAFTFEQSWTNPPNNPEKLPPKHGEVTECVVDGESLWRVHTSQPSGRMDCLVFTPSLAASVQLSPEGRVINVKQPTPKDVASAFHDGEVFTNLGDLAQFLPIRPNNREYNQAIRIDRIYKPEGPDQSVWKIDFAYRNPEDKSETSQRLLVDATAGWLVVNAYDPTDRSHGEGHNKLGTILGRRSVVEQDNRYTDKDGEWTGHSSLRELTSAEAQQVREKAEQLARRRPAYVWHAALVRPITVAVAWPGIAVLLLGSNLLLSKRGKAQISRIIA